MCVRQKERESEGERKRVRNASALVCVCKGVQMPSLVPKPYLCSRRNNKGNRTCPPTLSYTLITSSNAFDADVLTHVDKTARKRNAVHAKCPSARAPRKEAIFVQISGSSWNAGGPERGAPASSATDLCSIVVGDVFGGRGQVVACVAWK